MRTILKQALECLCQAYIPCLNITGDLVIRSRDHESRTVRSFIDVLMNILNRLNRGTYLDVNMRPELLKKVQVI
jgi:hypothetical protein